jgi:hypothetical protein
VTEKFSGFLADFLAEYDAPSPPRSPASNPDEQHSVDATLGTLKSINRRSETSEPATPSWRSNSQDLTSDSEDDTDNASTLADGDSIGEDEDLDTPGSPGSDIEMQDGIIRRGMYITVVMTNPERSMALPCTAKVLDVHDRRGKFTMRLTKSARRAAQTMWSNGPRSSALS